MDNKFKEEIQNIFPSLELTYLDTLTAKIALVPQVRLGNSLNYTDYEEVSLLNSKSENGVLIPNNSQKPSIPADAELVYKHSLKQGDLLLSYRAKNHIKVLRVKDTPKRSMVGNTATVRIEFKNHDVDTLPILIQSYLQLDMVQEYLINKAIENKKSNDTKRFLISPNILRDLPTPQFTTIDSDIDFEGIMMKRTHLSTLSGDVLQEMKALYMQSDRLLQLSLPSYINNQIKLQQTSLRDKDITTKLVKLQLCLKDAALEMEEYFKDEVL